MNNKVIAVIIGLVLVIGISYAVISNKNTPDGDSDDAYKTSQQVTNTQEDEVEDADGDDDDAKSGVTVEVNPGSVVKPNITVETTTTAKTFTMAEVQKHNSASSCYTAVNGSVYDVTAWISKHPGGAKAITSMCGKDASDAFDKKHGGQARPESELASYKIGTVTK